MATAFHLQHEECRDRVCVCCYRKASRSLSTAEVVDIQNYLIEDYDINHPDFPKRILAKKRNDSDYNLVKVEDYDPKRVRGLRSSSVCECRICMVAKMRGLEYCRKAKKTRGWPKMEETPENPTSYKVCSNCFAHIYRGINHSVTSCKFSRRDKVYNVENLVKSPVTLQRIASRVVRDSAVTPLSTLGPRERTVSSTKPKELSFTSEDLCGIQLDLQLSNTQTKVLAQDIRMISHSRKAVETGFKEKLVETSHCLDEYFHLVNLVYTRINKDTKLSENFG